MTYAELINTKVLLLTFIFWLSATTIVNVNAQLLKDDKAEISKFSSLAIENDFNHNVVGNTYIETTTDSNLVTVMLVQNHHKLISISVPYELLKKDKVVKLSKRSFWIHYMLLNGSLLGELYVNSFGNNRIDARLLVENKVGSQGFNWEFNINI